MEKSPFPIFSAIFLLTALLLLATPFPSAAFDPAKTAGGSCADCHAMAPQEAARVLGDMVEEVHGVELSEVPGLYVVDVTGNKGGRGLLYMDFSKTYVIAGSFISIAERRNITAQEVMKLRRVDLTTIPLEDSLVLGNPGAPTKLILFTDPQCPFCSKLHPEIKKLVRDNPGIAVFIKMLPLVKIHPDSYRIARTILCEGKIALLEDSFAGRAVPDPSCSSDAVDRTVKLAQDLGIGSTPTLILPDGRIAPGYRSAEDILKLLKKTP